jgi:predicted secreted protein
MTQIPAIDSFGTLLKIGDGEETEQFTTIARVADITGPNRDRGMHDATSHDSPAGYREHSPGLKEAGTFTFDLRWLPAEATHQALDDAYESGELTNFQIVYPDTATTTKAFSAYVKTLGDTAPVDGLLGRAVTLQISGPVTLVGGS